MNFGYIIFLTKEEKKHLAKTMDILKKAYKQIAPEGVNNDDNAVFRAEAAIFELFCHARCID